MKMTIIVLIVLAITAIFYWQFLVPAPSPAEQINTPSDISSEEEAMNTGETSSGELNFTE